VSSHIGEISEVGIKPTPLTPSFRACLEHSVLGRLSRMFLFRFLGVILVYSNLRYSRFIVLVLSLKGFERADFLMGL